MDNVTIMLLFDVLENLEAWTMFLGTLLGIAALIFVGIFIFRLAIVYAVRSIRRRFIEGRV